MTHLLEVRNLTTQFKTESGIVRAVNDVSYYIDSQEIVGIVGESGCGKSVTQLSVLQLIASPPGKIVSGEAWFEECDLLKLDAEGPRMRSIRGGDISFIFQEPMTSLNPTLTIKEQLTETIELHLKLSKAKAVERAVELLGMVGIPEPEERLTKYPHQFSGGMRQRIMIAIALSCNPKLVIADEATTALDVTTQAQVLELMKHMVDTFKTSLVIVTHNLGIVARYASRIYVMYAGRIIESGPSKEIFNHPRHPYTVGLMNSVPSLDRPKDEKLSPITGMPPDLLAIDDCCAFYPRCAYKDRCDSQQALELREVADRHFVRCQMHLEELR